MGEKEIGGGYRGCMICVRAMCAYGASDSMVLKGHGEYINNHAFWWDVKGKGGEANEKWDIEAPTTIERRFIYCHAICSMQAFLV